MNVEMAYLTGMILGNGEIQRGTRETTITIDIPYKNLYTDDLKDVSVYVKASTVDIRSIIEPLIGHDLTVTQSKHSTKMSFTKSNDEYVMRELMRLIGNGTHHSTMRMNPELFGITADEKKALQRGQNVRRRLAGAVVEGQTDPLLGHRLRLRGRFYGGRRGRGDEAFVRHRGQVALPAAYGRLCTAEYPQSEPRRRPDRKQQKAPQQSLMFAGFEKSHFQKPPS